MRATIIVAAIGAAAALWRAAASVPAAAPAPMPLLAVSPAAARPASNAVPPSHTLPAPAVTAPPAAHSAAALASIEAAVQEARRHGKGEQEVHRLRSAGLPAAQVEALARMEAAEDSWRRRVEALQAACAANVGCDDARASFTREELARTAAYAAPTLRQ